MAVVDNTSARHSIQELKSMRPEKKTESTGKTPAKSSPQMRQIIADFCRNAVRDYRLAGCPMGNSIDGMLIWFEYGQKTTRN